MILDGFGLNDKTEGNAVAQANKPNIDALMKDYPWVKGNASGLAVGLPDGQMGNSEVGHMNMGAGRIVYQELTRITKEIEDGDFFKNEALLAGMKNVKDNGSALHLYGLLSDGGVHSHITHLFGLLEMAKKEGLEKVYVHCFLDGRDTAPTSGKGFIEELEAKMKEIGVGEIATGHFTALKLYVVACFSGKYRQRQIAVSEHTVAQCHLSEMQLIEIAAFKHTVGILPVQRVLSVCRIFIMCPFLLRFHTQPILFANVLIYPRKPNYHAPKISAQKHILKFAHFIVFCYIRYAINEEYNEWIKQNAKFHL